MQRKAFTLIELLVVIAIIAILAAILFPVFAQAKLAAKKTQQLSNIKQQGTGILLYSADYDDNHPMSFNDRVSSSCPWAVDPGATPVNWVQMKYPYVTNYNLFFSPVDPDAGKQWPGLSWAGVNFSLSGNSYHGGWQTGGFEFRGAMGILTCSATGWLGEQGGVPTTSISQPASTVLLGERYAEDVKKIAGIAAWDTPLTNYGPGLFFSSKFYTKANSIPDGTRPTTNAYPNGPDGSVSAKFSGQATFVYCDTHAKSLKPVATNPDPSTRASDNQWDAKRS